MQNHMPFASLVGADDLDLEFLTAKYRQERDLRLRTDANSQYVEVTAEFSNYSDDPYANAAESRPAIDDYMEATVIGAGFAGLLAAARLRAAGLTRIRLIEQAGDVGGTWYWNRYPGAQCDIDSYVYLPLLEELGYLPNDKYAYRPEIFEHAQRIARAYELYEHALFQTQVTELSWDEDAGSWLIGTDRGDRLRSQYVVIAIGALSKPKLPAIPGINEFRGHTFHSSRWDYAYTGGDAQGHLTGLADKRVALIGTGATALQIVPHLGEWARQLYVFQRTPAVVAVRNNQVTDPQWAAALEPGWQRRRIENFTTILSGGDTDTDLVDDAWTDIYRSITPGVARRTERRVGRPLSPAETDDVIKMADMVKGHELRQRVESIVEDPATAQALKPWYHLFCKRLGFHDAYLDTFNRPGVRLVDTRGRGVDRLTPHGAVVGETEYEFDCLIFATGFEVSTALTHRTAFDPVGRDGLRLSRAWARGPRTLHGLQSRGFPNLFTVGIVQGATTINFTHMADEQARHIAHIAGCVRDRGASVVEVTTAGEEGWLAEMRARAPGRTRVAECTPSYSNSEGDLDNPHSLDNIRYGGGPVRFFALLDQWRRDGELAGLELRGESRPPRPASKQAQAQAPTARSLTSGH